MKKQKPVKTTSSSDTATNVDIPSQQPKPETTTLAPTATLEERLAALEKGYEKVGTVIMQIMQYIEKTPQNTQPIVNVEAPRQAPGGGFNLNSIMPLVTEGLKMFSGPSQPAADPFQMEVYKGMVESFKEGFKSYIQTVNQNAQIGAEVVKAIQKGSLKLETAAAGASP